MISAITRGCLSLDKGKCRRRQKMMIMPAYSDPRRQQCFPSPRGRRPREPYLDDENDNRIFRVKFGGVGSLEDTTLMRRPGA
jgi:hypothetical protein